MKTKKMYLALALGLTLAFTGCSSDSSEPQTEAPTLEPTSSASPHTGPMTEVKADSVLKGTVAETFDAGGYTYILLDNGQEKIWAAVGATTVKVGQAITLASGPVMKDFHSRSLDRTFPEIIFSAGVKGDDTMAQAPTAGESGAGSDEGNFMDALGAGGGAASTMDPAQATGGSSKAVVTAVDLKIDKATGDNAQTVEEIYTKAKDLNGKTIRIQAKVVKISPQIMGKNWLHLQDGSGNPTNNTHDLVVTTNDTPLLDSVITLEGVVTTDKDFGSGYFYTVIVEEGVVQK